MSLRVRSGRFGGTIEGDFVVFLIGMRVNRPWRVRQTLQVAAAMPRMLNELDRAGDRGLLGWRASLSGPLSLDMVQYWRSYDELEAYARDAAAEHLPAWREFRRMTGDDGSVGIWHETYLVSDGRYEAIYVNMPERGLAAAGGSAPLGSSSRSRERIRG